LALLLNIGPHGAQAIAHAADFSSQWLKLRFDLLHRSHDARNARFVVTER
jgi:hypothetical protein